MQLGEVIGGKYRLLRLLGDGGMGAVYEAHHEVLGTRVALKVLHEDLARKPELVDRFLREARVLAQILNAHVVRILDVAVPEGARPPYLVMELLTGESLSARVARERRLPLDVAIDFADQVLDALSAAHALGVVHRDLKPENILVTKEGERTVLKVIDFGIAKVTDLAGHAPANLTVAGALMGTPEYMAPEQAHSADRADARSDVFAVGVLLYEMLSGARPVEGDDPRVVAFKVEQGDVVPLIHRMTSLPRDLAGLVHRAMAPRPELRFANAAEMRAALAQVTSGVVERSSLAPRTPPPPPNAAPHAPSAPPPAYAPPASLAAPAAHISGATGTMLARPVGSGPSSLASPQGFAPSPNGFAPPYAQGAPPPAYAPPPQPQHPRGRPRGSGATVFLLVILVVLIGGGVAAALVLTGSHEAKPPRPEPSAPSDPSAAPQGSSPSPPSSAPSAEAPDADLGPLPSPSTAPPPHPVVNPPPRGSSSGAPVASVPSAPPSSAFPPPFGLPPFGLPSGFPNPFPLPASSGVGPVITIPTVFPPFGFPTDPTPPSPPASGAPPPRRGR